MANLVVIREYGWSYTATRMKTTIDIPDALAKEAKRVALERGTTLRELVVSGLRDALERPSPPVGGGPLTLRTFDGGGTLAGPGDWIELSYGDRG